MIKRTHLISSLLGVGLIIFGVTLAWQPLMQTLRAPHISSVHAQSLPSKPPINTQKPLVQGRPVRLQLPSLGLDLAVIDGYYNAGAKTWNLTLDKAQYATITPYANNREGNTFIYGHNRTQVFQNLYKIKPGEPAIITTDNNHTFTYKFTDSVVTSPNDNSLFQYQGPPILTLQTCSGLWYQNRQLFHFSLVSAS